MSDFNSYHLLKNKFGNEKIPYNELLSTLEWKECRDSIVKRDVNKCQICLATDFPRPLNEQERTEFRRKQSRPVQEFDGLKIELAIPYSATPAILHVHHTYYILNYLPWEYDRESLITVCQRCHNDIHKQEKILVYKDSSKYEQLMLTACERCNGTGYLRQFSYYENGICFACNGDRYLEFR
jgi:5-methylcytosine-specific restriction endonuclease McrA